LSANFRWKGTSPPTIVGIRKLDSFLLPHSDNLMILPSFVWIGYQRVVDGRIDGRNCCRYYSALSCKQCVGAVNINKNQLQYINWRNTDEQKHIIIQTALR